MSEKWKLANLPLNLDIETKTVLKSLPKAHAALAELKGMAKTIPDQNILINTLALQEAKDSSAIENIITTHDELYRSGETIKTSINLSAKEVQNYIKAMKRGFSLVNEIGLLTNRIILEIQEMLEDNKAGFRKVPGIALKNAITGETVYEPPQDHKRIVSLMDNLERYINDPDFCDLDPLLKMAIIHFQFESIHPFYDGNGRTGRIINILYLILNNLQSLPILYLSKYIIRNKADYYKFLQQIRTNNSWESWILFMIKGIEETSKETISLINDIKQLMQRYKLEIRENFKFYSHELLNNLFKHPYTKIEFIIEDLGVSRITAASYLNKLSESGYLKKQKFGKENYYINEPLYQLLTQR